MSVGIEGWENKMSRGKEGWRIRSNKSTGDRGNMGKREDYNGGSATRLGMRLGCQRKGGRCENLQCPELHLPTF